MLHNFSYFSPVSKKELLDFISDKGSEAKILAGGTDLLVDIRAQRIAPKYVVDIKKIEDCRETNFSLDDGLMIGSAVTLTEITERGFINSDFSLIADAAAEIASKQLRNRATAVGNICTASPGADMAPAFLAYDAQVQISSINTTRRIPLSDFFKGVKKTDLKPGEFVDFVIIPNKYADCRGKMMKLKRIKGHDLAIINTAALIFEDKIRLAAGSCAPVPVFLGEYQLDTPPEQIIEEAQKRISPIDDIRASAEYRRFMMGEYISRLLDYAKNGDDDDED